MKTLSANEAAEFLGIHTETFYMLAAAGKIPAAKVGRSWVCLDVDLAQWLRTQYRCKPDDEGNVWGSAPVPARTSVDASLAPTMPDGRRSPVAIKAAYAKALAPVKRNARAPRSR